MATKGFGTLLKAGRAVQAYLQTGLVGSNNALLWTAQAAGTGGNSITVELINPGAPGSLSVSVVSNAIAVTLAYAAGAITSTAADVLAAIKASAAASALVSIAHYSTSTGAGLMTAIVATNLASGAADVTYTTIAEVTNITGPSLSRSVVESTHMASTSGFREFIATIVDGGDVTFDLNFLPADDTQDWIYGLIHDINTGTIAALRIIWTDGATTTWNFNAWITRLNPSAPVEGKLSASLTVKLSGVPTLA
jgi:hypothetical protein